MVADVGGRGIRENFHFPRLDPTIGDLVTRYHEHRLRKLREKAGSVAQAAALRAGGDKKAAEAAHERAAADITTIGSDEAGLQMLKRHLSDLLIPHINSGTARMYVQKRRAARIAAAEEARAEGKMLRGNGALEDTTLAKELGILRRALAWAESESKATWFPDGAVPTFEMPVRTVSEPRVRHCTREQAAVLIEAAPMQHLRLFLRIGFATGARKEAIEELKWNMIDFDNGQYGAINFGAVEHRKQRPWIGVTVQLRNELLAAQAVRCSDWVIEYRGQKAGNVKKGIASTAKKAGLPWFTSHVMKHSVVTWMASGGGERDRKKLLQEIADYVNTTPATLRRHYRHLFADLDEDLLETLTLDV